ncbi:S41 family peptidase [Leekyejoonella antrihumi]|uniref:S41 family peptidase n=1 Tax=Leekyejoonella antrihumi TaxID=1660198 RepID=UPI001C978B7D|nr:S41 family peptidase [Leekyejoonella antrihumi]
MSIHAYLRFPAVRGDQVAFVADDDVWMAGTGGGRAYRISTDHRPATCPHISPDGTRVAWASGSPTCQEVYVAPVDGGATRQLTFWGSPGTTVRGWLDEDEVIVVSAARQADRSRQFAYAVPVDGGPGRRLPIGWVHDLALAPQQGLSGGALMSTANLSEPAWWKHYRGGTAAQLWWDATGDGDYDRILGELESGLVGPLWTRTDGGERIGFLSDHEGRGQLYSLAVDEATPQVDSLVRHTDHELYARHATSDGRQVVYVSGGRLHLLDSLAPGTEPRQLDIRLGGARNGLSPQHIAVTAKKIQHLSTDRSGRASAVEVHGRVLWLPHRDGPARALADSSDARRRLPTVLGSTDRVAWVSDVDGDDAVEIGGIEGGSTDRLVAPGLVGRVLDMAAAPDGRLLALATHDGRLLLVAVPVGSPAQPVTPIEVDTTDQGDVAGLAFSPDSRWLAWSAPGPEPLRNIRMLEVGRPDTSPFDVTPLRFTDTEPVFTRDGSHLAFLSVRSLDPVYDAFVFDLSFPGGCRPMLLPLGATTPSPFEPQVGGRWFDAEPAPDGAAGADGRSAQPAAPHRTTVDLPGLDQRIVPAPVAGGRYQDLQAVEGALVWLRQPTHGELGSDLAHVDDEPPRATLERLDLKTGKVETLVDGADGVRSTGDGKRLLVQDGDKLRLLPAERKVSEDDPDDVTVDLGRARIRVEPLQEWTQMYHEAWRLMRDHYWRADMGGIDWAAARDRYAPLLERVATRSDLVDLIWEMQGELGTSHAYCMTPPEPPASGTGQGLLGADLSFDGAAWRIDRIVPGESSEPRARSPLFAPGVAAAEGDAILAVDGRATSRTCPPEALLLGSAGTPVELTIAPADCGARRAVAVVPLSTEVPLRYQDWVADRRRHVHERTDGRVGYLHIPDMVSGGWAQLHRDLRTEVGRDGLIVDVRGNSGGHTSQLVIEKLARRIIGWSHARGPRPTSYPLDARRGPMVAVTDMYAGSDGDIVTAAIRSLGLGLVVGTRTWGGVIGIDGRYDLVDGTVVTQPRYAFWFDDFGWGVENHGVDPDIEVQVSVRDRVAGRDVQLDRALLEIRDRLEQEPARRPPALPPLP